jgi:dTDP-D-glucose 4,6-dehydratase
MGGHGRGEPVDGGNTMIDVLVTGGCGFIGSNFIHYLLENDPEVRVVNFDCLTYAGNPENLAAVAGHPRYRFVRGDVTDRDAVAAVVRPGLDSVIHFAAESHVDRSIQDSGPFVRSNVLGTQVLLDAARAAGVRRYVQVSCYDEETRVLTAEGLKYFSEVRVGERVLSLNPTTGQIEWKRVLQVIVQDYDGPMVVFKSNRIDLKVTPNHRMLYVYPRGPRPERLYEAEAEAVAGMSAVALPRGRWAGRDEAVTDVEGVGPVETEALFYVAGVFIGDGHLATQTAERPCKTGLPRPEYLQRARDRAGRFASGRFGTMAVTRCTCHRIFFDVPAVDKARTRLEKCLAVLGIPWKGHRGRAGEHVYFSSREWSRFFAQFGHRAWNKQIPDWMLDYAPRYLQALLDGVTDSDGYYAGPKRTPRITTSSFRLVQGLCEVGVKLGLMPRFSLRAPGEAALASGRVIRPRRPHYAVFFRDEWIGIGRDSASSEAYRGKIWCLRVEGNRNLVAERRGILTFCGNTDEVYGSLGPTGLFTEETPLAPNSPYAASKAAADLLVRGYVHTFGLPALITRCSNNYGPYQFPEKLIPLFISNLSRDEPVPVYGDGLNVRDWIHVRDHCAGVHRVWRDGRVGEVYNLGGRCEKTNLELTHALLRATGKPTSLIRYVKDRPGHDRRYAIDCSKSERELGWRPTVAFEQGLADTVAWYQSHADWVARVRTGEYLKYYERQYGRGP